MLDVIEQLLLEEAQEDWAYQLNDQEKAALQEGLDDLDAGRTEDYEAFMQRMQQRFQ
jgi:predicted transcriptional regulator